MTHSNVEIKPKPLEEIKPKPLADYAPRTYRKLNPKGLKRLTWDLLQLAEDNNEAEEATLLVAQYVAEQVAQTNEPITGIKKEHFVAGVLKNAGVVKDFQVPMIDPGLPPFIKIGQTMFVIDFKAEPFVRPDNLL